MNLDLTRRNRLRGAGAVWGLSLALCAAALALFAHLGTLETPAGELRLPWWALGLAFAVTEVAVVHVHFRGGAHTLTLREIPLVLGLLLATPADIVVGWVLGTAVALLATRGRAPLRVVFRLAEIGVTAGVAAWLFHALAADTAVLGPASWAAAGVAVLVASAASVTFVGAAMWLSGDHLRHRALGGRLAVATGVAITNASLGLAGATVVATDPRGAALLLVPIVAVSLAYRAYTSERRQHSNLEFLHAASRTLGSSSDTAPGLAGLLAKTLEAFRAELGEACLFAPPGEGPGSRIVVGGHELSQVVQPLDEVLALELRDLAERDPAGRFITPEQAGGALGAHLRRMGVRSAIIAPLPGERRMIGTMLVANRLGVGDAFSAADCRLFETLARQTGSSLGEDRLTREVAELRELQASLEHQAFHDGLTGLANRGLFLDRVSHALARREGNAVVLYLDLDDFKGINDSLGHQVGDDVLVSIADRLRDSLRAADTPARLGGDEFAVLLVDIAEEHVRAVTDRILASLARPHVLGGQERPVLASLGVATAASGTMNAEELMRNADVAMYVCKHSGKAGYSVYEPVAA